MGRQINFYMSPEIKSSFMDFLFEKSFVCLDDNREIQRIVTLHSKDEINKIPMILLYKSEYGSTKSFFDKNGEAFGLDHTISPVIEFRRSSVNEEKKWIYGGRLWIPSEYQLQSCDDFALFTKDYNMLVRWIKKHIPYQDVRLIHPLTDKLYFQKEYINDELLPLVEQGYSLM